MSDFIGAKDDGRSGDNWSYKTCKSPVKSSPPTNRRSTFSRLMPFLSYQSTDGKSLTVAATE